MARLSYESQCAWTSGFSDTNVSFTLFMFCIISACNAMSFVAVFSLWTVYTIEDAIGIKIQTFLVIDF